MSLVESSGPSNFLVTSAARPVAKITLDPSRFTMQLTVLPWTIGQGAFHRYLFLIAGRHLPPKLA